MDELRLIILKSFDMKISLDSRKVSHTKNIVR